MKMTDSQPAWMLSNKDESLNVKAVMALLSRRQSSNPPTSLFEFFGGIGGVTKAVKTLYPSIPFESWDMDDKCVEALNEIEGVTAVQGNSIEECCPTEGSGVLMDFNLWTILKARGVYDSCMTRVFSARPKWVQITDSSLSKLHINFHSYGLEDPTWDSYVKELQAWAREHGYALVDQEKAHHKTVMLLFAPVKTKTPR